MKSDRRRFLTAQVLSYKDNTFEYTDHKEILDLERSHEYQAYDLDLVH